MLLSPLTVHDIARMCGKSPRTIQRWRAEGKLRDYSPEAVRELLIALERPRIEEEYRKRLKDEGRLRRRRNRSEG